MSGRHMRGLHLSDLVAQVEMEPDLLTRLTALALLQAHIAATELHRVVIPALPASDRSVASYLARRLEARDCFGDGILRTLESLIATLERQVESGTHAEWEADVNHVRGGYETIARDPGVEALAGAQRELELLHDTVLATLSSARALREAGMLDG